jgi:putative hydrolase of HD superfamily
MSEINQIVNLLNEMGMLFFIPRSGFAFLGSGKQSVAEHSFRVALVAYVLARLSSQPLDIHKLVMMSLFHDLPEARIGDLNYVQKKYVVPHLDKALNDIASGSFLGPEIVAWIQEYEQGNSLEAQLAHDADQLELLLVLKREEEIGNLRAKEWMSNLLKRIQTQIGKQVAQVICQTSSDDWWWHDKSDPHWIDGGKGKHSKAIPNQISDKNLTPD